MKIKVNPPNTNESRIIKFMILLGVFSIGNFLLYFFHPEHMGNVFLFVLLSISILYSIAKKLYLWYNYSNISVPKPLQEDPPPLKVDILTTYFPGEPYQMIITTLEAILDITYPHETFLCDEANDPYLKKFCEENGIHHVTRDNRINAKAGNINNALRTVAKGDVCVILDPDHIPDPDFLDPILPYFNDPEIGFVQIVQAYYNTEESLVARGAAEQTFQFYGPIMMTLNAYGTVNAIGANCVFRRAALDSIGGHAPGLCEDMHTAMLLYSKGWKAVYLPVVLAKGLAPSNLTSFFKQQLKWARGSFDLLLNVYPRIFSKLTGRQKIHFGVLPMHYLSGLISFINFLIPILALFLATTPWRGNIVEFALVILPVIASSIFIRTYIQKWIIEKKERGFHLVGGLLHINTWWIYLLGLYYTITNKKILYLPTPKESEWATNLQIIVPNAFIALVSIIAIIYGLNQDLTPFSLVMAGFAFFNACIMSFGIFVAVKITNRRSVLRKRFQKIFDNSLIKAKEGFNVTTNAIFNFSRILALPLLLLVLIFSMSFKQQKTREKWEDVRPTYYSADPGIHLGIFHPSGVDGLTDLAEIEKIEAQENINFDIISYYLAWTPGSVNEFPHQLTSNIFRNNDIPMITWEPWASNLPVSDSIKDIEEENKVFRHITLGHYDDYLKEFIGILKSYDKPFFLRFAHEFDNPQYPWSPKGKNSPEEFIAAWRYIHGMIKKDNAGKIAMVWNPWKPEAISDYYPGDDYVDWIGITALNYGRLNSNGAYTSFSDLYQPFEDEMDSLTSKPVMLAEFGSLDLGGRQTEWIEDAVSSIKEKHGNIKAIVFFNSEFDQNIPNNSFYNKDGLNWAVQSFEPIKAFDLKTELYIDPEPLKQETYEKNVFPSGPLRGVRYKKNINWRQNYYALTKEEIQQDIELLRQAGINTILYKGGNIYDYNLLKYTEDNNIQLLYYFDIDFSSEFLGHDSEYLSHLKKEILSRVEDHRDQGNITGYVFPANLENYFLKPRLFAFRSNYFKWLKEVTEEIRSIVPHKPLIIELSLNGETEKQISELFSSLPVDAFGLIAEDTTKLKKVLRFSEENSIPVFISSINPELAISNKNVLPESATVLQNWQDERFFNKLSFDGLVDFEGRKKLIYKNVQSFWGSTPQISESFAAGIVRPAKLLYSGRSATYHAAIFDGERWLNFTEINPEDYIFEWNLIKNDPYGNPLALKKLGKGPEVTIEIPEDYMRYELLLTVQKKDRDYVIRTRASLHTPGNT